MKSNINENFYFALNKRKSIKNLSTGREFRENKGRNLYIHTIAKIWKSGIVT
jgi:hypothetical protein